jgi:predicted dehydrogenase
MTKIKIEQKEPLRVELGNFVAAVEKGAGQIVTGEEGLRNLDLALAFIASAVEGRVIHLSALRDGMRMN